MKQKLQQKNHYSVSSNNLDSKLEAGTALTCNLDLSQQEKIPTQPAISISPSITPTRYYVPH
jgi:hypothetical protein